jgi:hypothetical protein
MKNTLQTYTQSTKLSNEFMKTDAAVDPAVSLHISVFFVEQNTTCWPHDFLLLQVTV